MTIKCPVFLADIATAQKAEPGAGGTLGVWIAVALAAVFLVLAFWNKRYGK